MSIRTGLSLVALVALLGCSPEADPPPSPAVEPTLTPEEAREALLAMMHTPAGKQLGWFEGNVPDEMARMPIEAEADGWYAWTGAFRFHPAQRIYTFTVRPRRGARACVFEYKGTFVLNDNGWRATAPELVTTALMPGE